MIMEDKKGTVEYWQKRRKQTIDKIALLYKSVSEIDQRIHAIDPSKV